MHVNAGQAFLDPSFILILPCHDQHKWTISNSLSPAYVTMYKLYILQQMLQIKSMIGKRHTHKQYVVNDQIMLFTLFLYKLFGNLSHQTK